MTETSRRSVAESLLELTYELKRSIELGDLVQMEQLQGKRDIILKSLFAGSDDNVADDLQWLDVIRQVQVINQELIILATQARDAAGSELAGLRRMRKAESTYAEVDVGLR